jgi:hypothetical protein
LRNSISRSHRRRRHVAVRCALLALVVGAAPYARAHETGVPFMFVGATADGGGALALEHGFAAPIEATEDAHVEGFVRYTAADPSFEPPDDEDGELFFLDDGTTVRVEVTALGPTVAMKLSGVELDHVGAAVVLGTAPALHQHPEWQLTLPEGASGCQTISFRLTTDSPTYQASQSYTAYVTNDEATCAIAACGDPDGSGSVTVSDGVNVLRAAAALASACGVAAACDVDGSGTITVTDGVNVLRAAAGLSGELACSGL